MLYTRRRLLDDACDFGDSDDEYSEDEYEVEEEEEPCRWEIVERVIIQIPVVPNLQEPTPGRPAWDPSIHYAWPTTSRQNNEDCAICFESQAGFPSAAECTNCNHTFHITCAQTLDRCPMCRDEKEQIAATVTTASPDRSE